MNEELIARITREIVSNYGISGSEAQKKAENSAEKLVPAAVSNRHAHLSEQDFKLLFGENAVLTKQKDLSQPGQYASNEFINLIGPRGIIQKVRILGPFRRQSQVEISRTDSFALGLNPPVRDSGDLAGSCGIIITGPAGAVTLKEGVIIACRHIHMTPENARKIGVTDRQKVRARTFGERAVIFGEVLCRVSDSFALEMHIDNDEGNGALLKSGEMVEVIV